MTRRECLDKAAECVLQDRASQYGGPEDNFGRIAKLWSTYTGTVLDGIDVAMMMALLKVARIRNNKSYEDSYIDIAGYAACGAELAGAQKAREDATRRWGEEYRRLRAEAEGGCRPKGKDHSPEEPEFKPGDAVEWNSIGRGWRPAVYLREANDPGYCIVQTPDGRELLVARFYLRKAEANHPENPDSSTEAKPRFKHGDKVQYRVELPSVSDWIWRDATYLRRAFSWQQDGEHIVTDKELGPVTVKDRDIRPAPKAEGCEDLVQKDAPQTPRELYRKIIASNPATFEARTPSGKELAEMAEEEKRG